MRPNILVQLIFWPWLVIAIAAGYFRALQSMPPVFIPLLLWTITGALLVGYACDRSLRDWVSEFDPRLLVAVHLTRFVGGYFLVLYARGELPRAFAVPGGIGDLLVALFALALIALPLTSEHRRKAIAIWNVVGLLDLVFVVATAARLNFANPAQMRALTFLPLSLLPLLIVPLLITTHVILFLRTRAPLVASRTSRV